MDEVPEPEPPALADLPEDVAESPRAAPEETPVVLVRAKAKARAEAKAPPPPPPPAPPPAPEPPAPEPKPKARAKAKAKVKSAPAPTPAPTPEPETTSFPTFDDPVALLAAALHGAREQESQRRMQLYETFVFGKR